MTDLFQTWISDIWNSKKIFKLCPQVSMWVGEVRASSTFVRENVDMEEEKKKNDGKVKIKVLWDNKTMSRSWWDVLVKLFFKDHNLRVRSHKKCYHVFFKFHRSLNNFHRSVHFSHCFPRDRLVFSLIVLFIIIVTHGCSSCKDWCNRGVPGGSIFQSRLGRQF